MAVQMDIQRAEDLPETIEEPPSSSLLLAWAQAAWQGEPADEPALSLRIVSVAESQHLNNDYRGKNKPTNVLSFPMHMEDEFSHIESLTASEEDLSIPQNILGDLAICAEVVEAEAKQQAKSVVSHWAHMVVHGMLHLQGYDHIEDAEAEEMEQIETQTMQQLGFADPYQENIPTPIESSMTESDE